MTIRGRILAGHLAVAGLLLVPAIFAILSLQEFSRKTKRILDEGLTRFLDYERLRSDLESVIALQALSNNPVFQKDPDVARNLEANIVRLREAYAKVRPTLRDVGADSALERLDALVHVLDEPDPAQGGPPPQSVWTREEADVGSREINLAYKRVRERMVDESREVEERAKRPLRMSLAGLCVAGLLAIFSTILTVRGMRRPMERLMSATMAVSAGKFGIAVPVRGGDDDLSRLTDAFNKMSQNLAVFEKMKADFLSIAAHELRTPLTCIKGYVGALRASLPSEALASEKVARYLDRIDKEADLMAAQVSELLTLGIIEAGQLRLELREIPSEGFLIMVAEAFKPIATERGIEFRIEIGGVPRHFVGDRSRLNQVVLNLLDNAFKYTPAGGRVVLKGGRRGEMLEIEVSDTCPGIPPDQLGIIFEKYARVRSGAGKEKQGTGLGLAIAKGIVVAHVGTIEAVSETGHGCRFTVRLPVRPKTEPARAEAEEVA